MIRIFLFGEEGEVKEIKIENALDPYEVLKDLIFGNDPWQVDYTQASEDEKQRWVVAELFTRSFSCLLKRKPIIYEGNRYLLEDPEDLEELEEVAEKLENDLKGTVVAFKETPQALFIQKVALIS